MYCLVSAMSRLREPSMLQMIVFLEIEQELIHLAHDQNKSVCLMGDFNAKTGNLQDFFTPDAFLSKVDIYENFSHGEIGIRCF